MAAPHKMKTEENHTFGLHGGSKKVEEQNIVWCECKRDEESTGSLDIISMYNIYIYVCSQSSDGGKRHHYILTQSPDP